MYFKLIAVLRRADGISPEEFQRRWRVHAERFKEFADFYGIVRYVQNHKINTDMNQLMRDSRGGLEAYDGVGEIWWDSEARFKASASPSFSEKLRKLFVDDEGTFANLSKSSYFFTREYVDVGHNLLETPKEFICPIIGMIMRDPVITETGISYEKEAIDRWFKIAKVDPINFTELASGRFFPNEALASLIEKFDMPRLTAESSAPGVLSEEWSEILLKANQYVAQLGSGFPVRFSMENPAHAEALMLKIGKKQEVYRAHCSI
jgi:hypothetical protein